MIQLAVAFSLADPSARLEAALRAGMTPTDEDVPVLLHQCAVEPDFQVREMLTWALIRHPAESVVPLLIGELARPEPVARQQALHTLSKFKDTSAWPSVRERLDDDDNAVRRTAWYAAIAMAPEAEHGWVAAKLAARLGSGDGDTQRSLSRALVALGEDLIRPLLVATSTSSDPAVRQHVAATLRLLDDPESGYSASLNAARREVALGRTRSAKG